MEDENKFKNENKFKIKNLNLFVFTHLKQGLNPSQISKQFNLSKSRISYHLSSLKREGFIKQVGYGTWKIVKDFDQTSSKRHLTGNPRHLDRFLEPDSVRGHAFLFTIKIPNLRNWSRRRDVLKRKNIEFKELNNIYGLAERLEFKGRKVILTRKSVLVYERSSYFADTSTETKSYALYELGKLIKSLESYLGTNFGFKGQYKIKVSRQHYSLIKNALAKQYDEQGKRLRVFSQGELWLIIDNSFNLHEIETVHPITAEEDNKKVQAFFSGIKKYEGFTPDFLLNSIGGVVQNQLIFDNNITKHQQVLEDISKAINELRLEIKKLTTKE